MVRTIHILIRRVVLIVLMLAIPGCGMERMSVEERKRALIALNPFVWPLFAIDEARQGDPEAKDRYEQWARQRRELNERERAQSK